MKVQIVSLHYRPELTGNAPYVTSLAEALAANGHEVTVFCSMPFYPEWKIPAAYSTRRSTEQIENVTVRRIRHYVPRTVSPLRRLLSELSAGFNYLRNSRQSGRPDVVLYVMPALLHALLATFAPWNRGVAKVLWIQDFYSLGARETGTGPQASAVLLKWIERTIVRRVDRIVTIHDRFDRYVTEDLGAAEESTTVIRNWSHIGPDNAAPKSPIQVKERGSKFTVLHAGNQGVKQGLDNVVEAARLCDELEIPIQFVLMGNGNQHDVLRKKAEGVESITFTPASAASEFWATLSSADALLVNELPGLREMSVPSKLTSYFAVGRPVVAATDGDSVTAGEIAASGAGIRVDPNDPRALVGALQQLAKDPAACARLGANGPVYSREYLTVGAAVARFEAELQSCSIQRSKHQYS